MPDVGAARLLLGLEHGGLVHVDLLNLTDGASDLWLRLLWLHRSELGRSITLVVFPFNLIVIVVLPRHDQ